MVRLGGPGWGREEKRRRREREVRVNVVNVGKGGPGASCFTRFTVGRDRGAGPLNVNISVTKLINVQDVEQQRCASFTRFTVGQF